MGYNKQVVKYVKKNYFEKRSILKVIKLKEKRKYIILICEKLSISSLDLQMKKELEILKKRMQIFDKVVIKTKYIKEYLVYLLSEKYKKQQQMSKRIVFYVSPSELKSMEEEIKEVIEKNEELVYSSKKSKKREYNEKEVKLNILYVYLYDYFVSIEYVKEALSKRIENSINVVFRSVLRVIGMISVLKIIKLYSAIIYINVLKCQRLIK